MTSVKSRLAIFFLISTAFFCGFFGPSAVARSADPAEEPKTIPLQFTLRNGEEQKESTVARPTTGGTPLSAARIEQLLKMFKTPLAVEKNKPEFLKRPSSKPAPRSATPKEMTFPPTEAGGKAPSASTGPLEVLSISPQGQLGRAPRLSISFNNPMIAVSDPSNDELGDPLGVTIEPRPQGKWRWLGTQTLLFEPTGSEFPRATNYKVTVPAGISDIHKGKLAKTVTQEFQLPRPRVAYFSPGGSGHRLDPVIRLVFDQPIVTESTLALVHLKQGKQEIPLRQLSPSQAESLQTGISKRADGELRDRVFFFQATQKLRPGQTYTILVERGIESAEGPLRSTNPQSRSFSTYKPLALQRQYPGKDEDISPFREFQLYFNNALKEEKFDPKLISIKPEIPGADIRHYGNRISIGGVKKGKTTYSVIVSRQLTDRFGQTLGKDLTVKLRTGSAPKALSHAFGPFTVLDPTVDAGIPIYTTNVDKLDIEIYKVEPKDWQNYLTFLHDHRRAATPQDRKNLKLPGKRVYRGSERIKKDADSLVSTRVDISKHLNRGEGNLIVWVKDPTEKKERYRRREFFTWVQGTKIGIDLEIGPKKAVVLATNLLTGKPLPSANVQLGSNLVNTQSDGQATLNLGLQPAPILTVESQGSVAFIPNSTQAYGRNNGWQVRSLSPTRQWFVFNDRGLYKPGEKARVKGYIRAWQRGPKGQLAMGGQTDNTITWTLKDPRGNKVQEGSTQLSAFSSFDLELQFPKDTNLGQHRLELSGPDLNKGYHSLKVQEFRRPEFEVATKVISSNPHLLQDSANIEATASYYAGGALTDSKVSWSVSASQSSYTPPGRSDYTFGQWTPWWNLGCWWDAGRLNSGSSYKSFQAKTNAEGKHLLAIDFLEMYPPKPTTVSATASVADVNRQQQSSTTSVLVHPSERYVGMKAEKSFVDEKSPFPFSTIVTNIDGQILAGVPLEIELYKVEYKYTRTGGYKQTDKLVRRQNLRSSELPNKVILNPDEGGTYRIKTKVKDQAGRPNQTEYTFWKAGGELPTRDKVELENLTVVPDRKEYEPGQTARILVMAPFSEGEGTVVWHRDGVESSERFTLTNGTATLEHPLTDAMIPNLRANITAVGTARWGKRIRPAVAASALNLSINKKTRQLTVKVLPSREKLEPGSEVDLEVEVKNHQGQSVPGAEITLWVVDEAVLGLTGYGTPAPLSSFYGDRGNMLSSRHNRTFISLADPKMEYAEGLAQPAPPAQATTVAIGGESLPIVGTLFRQERESNRSRSNGIVMDGAFGDDDVDEESFAPEPDQAQATQFEVRKNFDAMATFKGQLATNASGRTVVKVKLPDNLTRYRIMSVAVADSDKFGHGDQVLTARLPIMVRPSLPRFLNFGDKAMLPVVIQNQTDQSMSVDIVGQATGIKWLGAAGQKVTVPANDRVEVMFEAQADQVGQAHFRFGAVSGGFSDAATLSLPVYTPASGEAFATYGSIAKDEAIEQLVRRPKDVWSQFGGLQISLSSTALSELTDAFLYLYEYPYECAEQKSSRILAVAAMKDVLKAFNPSMMPTESEIASRMKKDLVHLQRVQNNDGGWEFWRKDEHSKPFVTLHVMHALVRAKVEGYQVNERVLERGLGYLQNIEAKCRALDYGESTTRSCMAYALFVRHLASAPDPGHARTLFTKLAAEKQPNLDAIGWLWPTLAKQAKGSAELSELRRLIKNRVTQTANKAQFTTSFREGDGAYLLLNSSRRTDSILLGGMLSDQPQNQLNSKLVRGLLAHRKKGRWNNTQENIWILLALQSYFREYEKETPNFLASLWLDQGYLGEEKFVGRSGKQAQLKIPMNKLSAQGKNLVVAKKGAGRLYYRIGMDYAPKSLRLPAENRGFLVERSYKGLDAETDVKQLENGDWQVKAGAKVEVTLTMVAPERRHHVALVDQLPAGLEPLNPALKGTPPTSTGSSHRGYSGWWWRWYEHENLRDERVEAFASLVYPGVYTYTYTALATTPGEYVLPPLKAEEMYSPEVFGRTATGRLIVE